MPKFFSAVLSLRGLYPPGMGGGDFENGFTETGKGQLLITERRLQIHMQDQEKDLAAALTLTGKDSLNHEGSLFVETQSFGHHGFSEKLYSRNISGNSIPDWYFIILIVILSVSAWARIVYAKFLNAFILSAYSYQMASKTYKDQGIVQRRFGFGLDLLYLVNASLFLYLLNLFFVRVVFDTRGIYFLVSAFLILGFLVFLRVFTMRLIGFIFSRSSLFLEFLYHYFIFNKLTGLVLIPFLIAIPYTQGKMQEIIIYAGISLVVATNVFRLVRASVFVFKNVVLYFYLILYLCTLEIIPVLVIFKLLVSMAKV